MFKDVIKFALQIALIAFWMLFSTAICIWLALYFGNIAFIFLPIAITIVVALYTEEKRKRATEKEVTAPTVQTEFKLYPNALNEYEKLIKKENNQQKEKEETT